VGLELVGGHTMVTGVRSTATFQALMLSGEAEVSRSTFNSTGPAVGEAVALRNATVSLRDVVVEGALTCIAATASTFSLATSSLARCAYGVGVQPTSQGTIYGNAFGPGVGGIDASSATRWDDGAHGNHWANFTDAVKPVPPNGADHHPLPGRPCSSTSDWALPRCA
jgi:hypothetical protein